MENILDIVEQICQLASASGDAQIIRLADSARRTLARKHRRSIALVSDAYARRDMLRLAGEVTGLEVPVGVLPESDMPVCILFTAGDGAPQVDEQTTLLPDGTEYAYTRLTFSGRSEYLGSADLSVWCGVELAALGRELLEELDYVFLLTNATQAMPMSERDWLRETVTKYFGCDRAAVAIYNMDLMNSDEDAAAVTEAVAQHAGKISGDIRPCGDVEGLAGAIRAAAGDPGLEEKRVRSIAANCLDAIQARINEEMSMGGVDLEKLKTGAEKIERERRALEASSKMAVEGVVDNLYARVRYELINAASDYSDELVESVSSRLEQSDSVEDDVRRIPAYLEAAWTSFEVSADQRVCQRNEEISQELSRQIELDCRSLLKYMDIPELENAIVRKLSFRVAGEESPESGDMPEETKRGVSDKLIKGGIFAVTFVLAMAHPVLGLGVAVAEATKGLVSKTVFGIDPGNTEKLRTEAIAQLKVSCSDIKKQVVASINASIDDVSEQARANVVRVYGEVIDKLVEEVAAQVRRVGELKARQAELSAMTEKLAQIRAAL